MVLVDIPLHAVKIFDRFVKYCDTDVKPRSSTIGMINYTSDDYLEQCMHEDIPVARDNALRHVRFDSMDRFDLIQTLSKIFQNHSIQLSGDFLYPPGGFMSWHTNSNTPGDRVYLTYVPQGGKSFFKYRDADGKIVTSYDQTGWTMRHFRTEKHDLLWHCVGSETYRLSIGFRIMKNLKS